jgi:hypothetical protein
MTGIQYAGLGSASLGAIGTIVLFFNSYAFEPLQGGVFASDAITECNNRIRAENRRRLKWQRIGIGILCLSFIVQDAAALL